MGAVLSLGLIQVLHACDACGCSMSGSGIGILSGFHQNSIGLSLQRALYHSAPDHGNSDDAFNGFGLHVRYHMSKRIIAQAVQPFVYNVRHSEGATQHVSGLGDTRLTAVVVFRDRQQDTDLPGFYAEAGIGVKLPTGKFDPDIHKQNLPENFNAGQGNTALLLQPAFVITRDKMGLACNGLMLLQLPSSNGYRYGHQGNAELIAFRNITVGKTATLIPLLGMKGDVFGMDRHTNKHSVTGTGGHGLYTVFGMRIMLGKMHAGFSVDLPVVHSYAQGEVLADGRQTVQLIYAF